MLALAVILAAPAAFADRRYLGGDLTRSELTFEPEVQYPYGRATDRFLDKTWGNGLGLFGGREFDLTPQWSVSAQGRLGYIDAEWTLTTPRSHVQYDMPYSIALILLPEYRLTESFSLFGELGGAVGQFNYRKQSNAPTAVSTYDESTSSLGYVVGAGLRYALTPRLDLQASYRFSAYQSHDFVGRLTSGEVRELFAIEPSVQDIAIAMRWSW